MFDRFGVDQPPNGFAAGELLRVSFTPGGALAGHYSNGQSQTLDTLRITLFPNEGGLLRAGNTMFVEAPNSDSPINTTAGIGGAIISEATLSFLGLGLPPLTPSWGRDLFAGATRIVETAPWLSVFPGIAISLTVYGFNLFGDALRDVLDARLRVL